MRDKAKTVSKELVGVVTATELRTRRRSTGEEEGGVWGRIRTDMERKKNTEGDVLERQKCERRGREIRRDWWERRGKMRGRVVSERNAGDKAGRRGKEDRREEGLNISASCST